jgi:hypothetical protein
MYSYSHVSKHRWLETTTFKSHLSSDQKSILLKGSFFDTVTDVQELNFDPWKSPNRLKYLEQKFRENSDLQLPSGHSLTEVRKLKGCNTLWRMLLFGGDIEFLGESRLNQEDWNRLLDSDSASSAHGTWEESITNPFDEVWWKPEARPRLMASAIQNMVFGKAFFTTTIGFCGIGPLHVKPGDIIVLLENFTVPTVLRPSGTGFYTMIGIAYVNGVMDFSLLQPFHESGVIKECIFEVR